MEDGRRGEWVQEGQGEMGALREQTMRAQEGQRGTKGERGCRRAVIGREEGEISEQV